MPVELTKKHLVYMNIGRRYWSAELSRATKSQKTIIRPYASNLKSMIAKGVGLYLCGPNGTGKTYLVAALLKEAWRRWRVTGYCVTAAEIKEGWIKDREAHYGSEEMMASRVEICRLLVVDDLGKEHRSTSGFFESRIGALFRLRSRGRLTTLVTTNLRPNEFEDVYGRSTSGLLKECTIPLLLEGDDMRNDVAASVRHSLEKGNVTWYK